MGVARTGFSVSKLLNELEDELGLQTKIKWKFATLVCGLHAFALYWSYLYAFPVKWQTLAFAFVTYIIGGSSVTCGLHRLWSHKSYKATLPLRIYLMLGFVSTGQNTIYQWVRDHRVHHKYSDTEADPHNVKRGFFFSHIGWLLTEKNKLVLEKGRQIDMSDILQDPVAAFEHKHTNILRLIFCLILPTTTGVLLCGESWQCALAWQFCIRWLFFLHTSFSINSFAHSFGYKPYNKHIEPADNMLVSFISGGEGSHNYHHTFPWDYKAAESFDFVSFSTFFLNIWAKMGLAYDLKEASPQLIRSVIEKQKLITEE